MPRLQVLYAPMRVARSHPRDQETPMFEVTSISLPTVDLAVMKSEQQAA